MNHRSTIYTSGVLETLYSLKSSDIKSDSAGNTYVSSTALLHGDAYIVGLCDKEYKHHILSSKEKMMIELLLNWDSLVNDEQTEKFTTIKFTDIDWMKNCYKKNMEHIKAAHNLYKEVIKSLSNLYLVYNDEEPDVINGECTYPLLKCQPVIENNKLVGITYSFDKLGKILNAFKMKTTLNGNIFKFKFNEEMKYWILRYLIVSIFMNRVKSKVIVRTHKSILKALIVDTGTEITNYYDTLINKKYMHKYLHRYIQRLKEVLEFLKEIDFIKEYSVETITNIQELQTGCGLIRIKPNMSNKKHRTRT